MQLNRTRHQRGVVLIISLILLLVMTLVGATSIRMTSMQERMSGNIQDKYLSFQQAETALRDGEEGLIADIEAASSSLTYLYPGECDPNCWKDGDTSWPSEKFIVEELGRAPLNKDCSLELDPDPTCYVKVYRVTGQGNGQLEGTLSMVQSTIKVVE